MRYPDEGEPSPPLPWIEDDELVEDVLRAVVIPHEGHGEPEGDDGEDGDGEDGDGGKGADGDSSRGRGRAA